MYGPKLAEAIERGIIQPLPTELPTLDDFNDDDKIKSIFLWFSKNIINPDSLSINFIECFIREIFPSVSDYIVSRVIDEFIKSEVLLKKDVSAYIELNDRMAIEELDYHIGGEWLIDSIENRSDFYVSERKSIRFEPAAAPQAGKPVGFFAITILILILIVVLSWAIL